MSLEQALAENTAANIKLAEMIGKLVTTTAELRDIRADAVEKVAAAAALTGKGKKDKEEPAKGAETKGNISTSPEDRKNPEEVYGGLKELVAGYVTGTDREEEREARKGKIRELLQHAKIKKPEVAADAKPDVTNIMESAIPLFKDQIAKLTAKGDLTEAPAKKAADDLDL